MGDRVLVGTRKGLFALQRNGVEAWTTEVLGFAGDPVTFVLASADGKTIFAALKHGHFGPKLHRSTDGGSSWQECATPALPAGEGAPSVEQLWSMATNSDGSRLWCGTIPGALFSSDDQGESWQLNEALWNEPSRSKWFGGGYSQPGIHSLCAHPNKPESLMLAISCGGIWSTADNGESWRCSSEGMLAAYMPPDKQGDPEVQDPHCMVRCPTRPDMMWVQHHCGAYRSINGGRTWRELDVPPSSFGFAVAVHPTDPETAWFIPAKSDEHRLPVDGKVVVSRTRDGGSSFDVLTDGLPQEHAYDLMYRHALDIDDSGDRLAMGSTTGALWVTEDQGDRWSLINAHLPPVYCVRFA